MKPDQESDAVWDPTPGESFGYLFRDTYRAYSRALERRLAPHGVSIGQWPYLTVLWNGEGLTQRELSERLCIVETTAVDALAGMERAGLITRIPDPTDGRQRRIFLTTHGRQLRKKLLPLEEEVSQLATDGMEQDDIDLVRSTADHLSENLRS